MFRVLDKGARPRHESWRRKGEAKSRPYPPMYVELHARSAFSFLQGASLPEEMAQICADHGMGAMALVDRDGVYGSPRFHQAAKKLGIKAHIGAEVMVDGAGRWPLLALDRTGYRNLCRLVTRYK